MIISNQQVQSILKLQTTTLNKQKAADEVLKNKQDTLELSSCAQDLKSTKEIALKSPDIRTDKINELKSNIQAGRYQISGTEIALKMIDRSLVDELAGR